MPVPGYTVTTGRRGASCPSPSFDARNLKNAQWSNPNETPQTDSSTFKDLPQTWTPRNNPSPSPDRKEFRPLGFDSNSLKRNKRSISSDSAASPAPAPPESFAWKDSTLERQLKDLQNKKFSDAPPPREGREGGDKGLDRSLERWSNTPLPKAEDPDVTLLKKARQEKKVKRYLEDNFRNREGNYANSENEYDSDIGALSTKYTSLDRRRELERNSPPKSPPPFSKAESRFEREQRIKVGSLDSYTPGGTLKEKSLSPPPAASSAQAKYERDRFRVEPGRIQDYAPGRCSLANQEVYKAGLDKSGCGITKYSSSHSFNPLLLSKSATTANLALQKESPQSGNNLQKTLKDGYESDSSVSYRKHCFTPTNIGSSPSPHAKALYTQVQKGGEVPLQGLRMQAPEKKEGCQPSIQAFMAEPENPGYSRPTSSAGSTLRRDWGANKVGGQTEEEVRVRQKEQLNQFYSQLDQQKEYQLRVDQESRKHHDTLLPSQKSPVPLNRYEEQDVLGNQALFLNAGKKPDDCKMVARALFSFQAQNNRELSFKKGDIIYIKKQVDTNWYEGERNAMLGIFPTTYVDIIPQDTVVTTLSKKERVDTGQAKAKFTFTAQTPMELSFSKGESIVLTRRIDRNWFEGRVGSRKGILPVAYVDILQEPGEGNLAPPSKPSPAPAAHSILKNGSLPGSGSYLPQYDKPKSTLGSASPYSTLSRPGSSMSNGAGKADPTPFRALYNYKPQNEDEVELHEGDIVYVMEKCDDGWFVGTSQRTGIFGTFPGNYVTQI